MESLAYTQAKYLIPGLEVKNDKGQMTIVIDGEEVLCSSDFMAVEAYLSGLLRGMLYMTNKFKK